MAKFILLGELGKKFGNEFNIKARNTNDAIKAMNFQLKGFKAYLSLINIRIRINGVNLKGSGNADMVRGLMYPVGKDDVVIIAPTTAGAGGNNIFMGVFMIVAGIVAVVLAAPTGGASIAAWSAANIALAASGAIMVLGGAAMLFTKTPSMAAPKTAESSNDSNTSFSQIDNLAGSGRAVPLAYGRNLVGSFVIQSSVKTLPR